MEIKQIATSAGFSYLEKWEHGPQTEFIVPSGTFTNKETGTITLPSGLPRDTTVVMNSGAGYMELHIQFPSGRRVTVKEIYNTGDSAVQKRMMIKPEQNYLNLRRGWKR